MLKLNNRVKGFQDENYFLISFYMTYTNILNEILSMAQFLCLYVDESF